MSPLEIVAVICGVLNIWLTVRQNIWSWAFGAVMVSLYIYITYVARLYSDALLNVFFLVMQFYGWYEWTRGPVVHEHWLDQKFCYLLGSRSNGYFKYAGIFEPLVG